MTCHFSFLHPCEDFPITPEFQERTEALTRVTEAVKERGGYLLGDMVLTRLFGSLVKTR